MRRDKIIRSCWSPDKASWQRSEFDRPPKLAYSYHSGWYGRPGQLFSLVNNDQLHRTFSLRVYEPAQPRGYAKAIPCLPYLLIEADGHNVRLKDFTNDKPVTEIPPNSTNQRLDPADDINSLPEPYPPTKMMMTITMDR